MGNLFSFGSAKGIKSLHDRYSEDDKKSKAERATDARNKKLEGIQLAGEEARRNSLLNPMKVKKQRQNALPTTYGE